MAADWPELRPFAPAPRAAPPRMFARPALRSRVMVGSVSWWSASSGLAGGIGLPLPTFALAVRSAASSLARLGSLLAAALAWIAFVSRKFALQPDTGAVAYDEQR